MKFYWNLNYVTDEYVGVVSRNVWIAVNYELCGDTVDERQ